MRRHFVCRLSAAKPYNRASPVENRQTALRAMEMHPFCRLRRRLPRRGRFALRFPSELCGTLLSIHSAPAFAGERWCRRHQRGESGRRPLIIVMLFLLMNPKASSRNQPAAGSWKPAANCLLLCPQRFLPAHWYLGAFLTLTALTEILHFVQNDSGGGKARHVTQVPFSGGNPA